MTIRSRLLLLLLPTLAAFVGLIALLFYFNWSQEILNSFKSRLKSVVIATAQSVDPKDIQWITEHLKDPQLNSDPRYLELRQHLIQLKQQLNVNYLYIVRIEPFQEGEAPLLHDPSNPTNKVYHDQGVDHAYQQVFLLDASQAKSEQSNAPGDIDFSETEEHRVYFTKKAFATSIYESRKTGERFMSAYAPILDEKGEVAALVGADVSVGEIDQKLQNALLIIFTSALATVLLATTSVFLIADRISKPVQKLNQAALDIAAGNYEANIEVQGPKEIVELANTLNVMSECLVENISRLKESSLIRERMYGEYECALLLQHFMLQKVVEDFHHPHIQMRLTTVNSSNTQKGISLKVEKEAEGLNLVLIEASQPGFEALYYLNQSTYLPLADLQNYSYIKTCFRQDYSHFYYQKKELFAPLVWSIKSQQFIRGTHQDIPLQNQDMIFMYNSEVVSQFETEDKIEKWFSKILRHFAEDGLDTIHTMLTNELSFLTKRENLKRNFQILSLQIKIPEIS